MKISLKNSGVLNGGAAIPPTAEHMEFGEVAINYSATDPAIFIKDSSGVIRRVSGKGNISFDNYQAVIPISSVGPGTAANGNLYWDQDDERLYIYNGTAWKDASKLPFNAAVIPDLTNAANQSGTFDDRYLRFTGGTLTGALTTSSGVFVNSSYINLNNSNIAYQGASNGQGGFFKTTIDAINATANNTINFPNRSGTVITTGDSGSITASMISSGSITDAQISSTAAISPSKLATGTLPSGVQVNSANIVDGSIVNADISGSAAIDLTKLGTGNLPSGIQVTTNNFTGGIPASDITSGTLGSDVKVSSASYQAGSISNAAISNTAEIAVSKLADGSARQLLQTNAFGNDVEWASDIDIPGTLDVTGNAVFDGRVTISDVFTVNSSEITLNAPIVNITDKNITLNSVASPSDANADGGGLSVAGSTTKTFTYDVSNSSFTSSEHLNLVNGKGYEINGASVLTHTTLGAGVVNSSLESVGTISSGTWQGSVIDDTYISTIDTAGKVANSATTATPANTPNSIVSRNASGDFTARIINAALSGNASTATALETARTIALSGDLSGSVSFDGTSNVTINAAIASSVTDTNLSWTPSTMTIGSSTGDDVNLTLFTSTAPGLTPYSGGGTTNFLRADGTWAEPQADSTNLSWTSSTSTINSSTGTGVAIPAFDSYNKGLVPSSGGGTTKFLRADGSWVTVGTTASQGADLAYVASTRTVTNTNGDGFTLPEATTSDAGLLSSTDKTKLDGVAAGAEVNTVTSVNGQTGAVTINGTTDLSYTASSRLLESSTGNDVTLPEATTSDAGLLSSSDKTKLDSISSNAAVTSVNAATGVVVLDADDIDDTSTNHKFVTASDVTALSTLSSDLAGKADLSNGKLDTSQLPDLAISEFKGSVANETAMLAVTGEKGDWVIRTDNSKVYVITGNDPSNSSNWTALSYPVAPDTDLSYASSTRVLSSSTGTDTTLPEVVAAGDSGLMTGSDKTKLDGIEAGATADQTAAEILTAVKTVDGASSGLDADLLDGQHGSHYLDYNNFTNTPTIPTNNNQLTNGAGYITSADGGNAGTLDGIDSSSFLRSDAADTFTQKLTGGLSGGAMAFDLATNDNYASMRVIQNKNSSGDGMYLGFQNGNNGVTRIFGGGAGTGGIEVRGSGTTDVKINGNTAWHAGNDGSGSGLDADTVDGIQASSFLRSDSPDTISSSLTLASTASIKLPNTAYYGIRTSTNHRVIDSYDSTLRIGDTGKHSIIRLHGMGDDDFRVYYGGNDYEIWHAGNDGSGSGLDADNLDGYTWTSSGKNLRGTEIYADNWFRNYNSGEGLYNEANAMYWYSDDNATWRLRGNQSNVKIRFATASNTTRGYLYADTNPSIGFLNTGHQWGLRYLSNDGNSPNLYFYEEGNETWTGNPGNDVGKIEYHSNRFYIASGANSTEIARFRHSGNDRVIIENGGEIKVNGNLVYHAGNLPASGEFTRTSCNTIHSSQARDGGTGSHNFFAGVSAGNTGAAAQASHIIAIGNQAGKSLSSASHNTFFGCCAGASATTGHSNFAAGHMAGRAITTGCYNTIIGNYAGCLITTSSGNFFVGLCAGKCQNGTESIMLGSHVGKNMTFGSYNVVLGTRTACLANGFSHSFVTGYLAGCKGCNAQHNFIAGYFAGRCLTNACKNVYIGCCAGMRTSSGCCNIYMGTQAGVNSTTGGRNVAIATSAGANLTTGQNNVFLGTFAGVSNSTGNCNIAIGCRAGNQLTSGANNILIGCCAGATGGCLGTVTTGSNNIFLGNCSHGYARINISWTTSSDCRDKCIYRAVPHGRTFLQNINTIEYALKDRETGCLRDTEGHRRYGFSAQNILEAEGENPVIVNNEDPNKLLITTDYITPILVNAVNELSVEIDEVKARLTILENS